MGKGTKGGLSKSKSAPDTSLNDGSGTPRRVSSVSCLAAEPDSKEATFEWGVTSALSLEAQLDDDRAAFIVLSPLISQGSDEDDLDKLLALSPSEDLMHTATFESSKCTHILTNFGRHKRYFDGKPRPLFRGWIHGIASLALMCGLLLSLDPSLQVHWKMQAFMAGKFVVLAASATYHLVPFTSLQGVRAANIMDLILIPFSMWASVAPFSRSDVNVGFWNDLLIVLGIIVVNGAIVLYQFSNRHASKRGTSGDSRTPRETRPRLDSDDFNGSKPVPPSDDSCKKMCSDVRHGLLFVYFSYVAIQSARAVGVSGLWGISIALYLLSFTMAKFVDDAGYSREPMSDIMPHHTRQVWSLHEDFHLTLLLADAFSGLMVAHYLYTSSSLISGMTSF